LKIKILVQQQWKTLLWKDVKQSKLCFEKHSGCRVEEL
jgi:hypothetical protein